MKTIEIIGYKRANLGKSESKRLREEGMVPCVVYGDGEQEHFYSPAILFRDLIYTPEARFVKLNVEGKEYDCIMQDNQFHPVSESILHVDFLKLKEDRPVKMNIPVKLKGNAPGIVKGGKMQLKVRHLRVKALPKDMPEHIEVDVSKLDLGKSVKVGEIKQENYEIQNNNSVSIATVIIPRALRGKKTDEEGEDA
ncbi:50S ribosomal protein L25/general stress protein Ctc [Roseivirga sp. BDSF3-8]|uniref:50S ribosomal protein L25/general stress protein Ctc n=1 Tax=Roseivirga sp. BDSF3-8 TaxID=3241598 RepID=UPI00353260F9